MVLLENRGIIVEEVIVTNSSLSILPADKSKTPLHFDLHRVRLESVGKDVGMRYDAALTNPKPPGEILSKGTLGTWTAVNGKYTAHVVVAADPNELPVKQPHLTSDTSLFVGLGANMPYDSYKSTDGQIGGGAPRVEEHRRGELAAGQALAEQDVAGAVEDDAVRDAVAIEVGQMGRVA